MSRAPHLTQVSAGRRTRRRRHYLMCAPRYFEVTYAINPWMDPSVPVDPDRALAQWLRLVDVYRRLGHRVDLLDPVPGLPDMVFAANGSTVIDGRVLTASFVAPQRRAEAAHHAAWHRAHGSSYRQQLQQPPSAVNEAEGDFAVLADVVLAGYGFRTTLDAHAELGRLTGREVVSLELVDPRFYHLDVALCVLDDRRHHIAYLPEAFSPESRQILIDRFPDAIIAGVDDALAFGLNAVSDGRHVILPPGPDAFAAALTSAGYQPIFVDLSELAKGGGSVKCCTQEIRPARRPALGRTPPAAPTTSPAPQRL
ncbi:MAG: dimethylargininase [Propionibacteriaceae bacterium]